ncbi:hypothetical protein V7124_19420 [Neobacillus niacini]|uniref:hypothetical protein n=1 Tax=Neobacillus niacini TaxID=86668 RepID=UPI002FFF030A
MTRHFSYTEEYVLSHSPSWLSRKFEQAKREQYEDHQTKVLQGFQSALLVLDAVFNKGKEFNKILPPSIEAAMEQSKVQEETKSKFVEGTWWKSDTLH